jgi:hypothetical protein
MPLRCLVPPALTMLIAASAALTGALQDWFRASSCPLRLPDWEAARTGGSVATGQVRAAGHDRARRRPVFVGLTGRGAGQPGSARGG